MKNSLAVLLIIIGVLAGTVGGYTLAPSKTTNVTLAPAIMNSSTTSTVVETRFTTQTSTTVELTTLFISSSQVATNPSTNTTTGRVYEVTFQQVRYCGKYNILPWTVTLNGQTEVQPSNQTLPLPTNTFSTIVPNQNLTRMTLSVPSGT